MCFCMYVCMQISTCLNQDVFCLWGNLDLCSRKSIEWFDSSCHRAPCNLPQSLDVTQTLPWFPDFCLFTHMLSYFINSLNWSGLFFFQGPDSSLLQILVCVNPMQVLGTSYFLFMPLLMPDNLIQFDTTFWVITLCHII